jgi:8-oxo-dGTP diphosphatase
MKQIHVVVGVVMNADGDILLSKRAAHLHQGGLWEFPGGKVEQGENVFDALVREFQEEVNITIQQAEPLLLIEHDYGDKHVILDVWQSAHFSGELKSNEGQPIQWVKPQQLNQYPFPAANQAIISHLMR